MIKRKTFAAPIVGGPGNDNYLVTDPSVAIFEATGGGYDTVYVTVSYTLTAGSEIEVLTVYDRDTIDAINLTGNAFGQTIYGNNGSNALIGDGGADVFYGLGGDDRYLVDSLSDQVFESAGGGYDTVYTFGDFALNNFSHVEALTIYDRDTVNAAVLFGNNLDNVIYGNQGSNALYGGGGTDTFYGLGGDDGYVVDGNGDTIFEASGQGYDTVYTTGDFALNNFSYVEALSVYDRDTTNALTLFGNNLDNVIYGNQGSNALIGGGGTDTIYGLGGDDRIVVDSAGDVVIEFAGGGNDTLYTTLSYALALDAEVETLAVYDRDTTNALDLTGNGIANTIYGNNGSNFLNGNGGADTYFGLGGDDRFLVDSADDMVIEFAGQGIDTVYTTTSYALSAEVEILTAYDRTSTNGMSLTGNSSANVIYGNGAMNVIDGKSGNDTLYGMVGNDWFAFTTALGAGNVDILADFEAGLDKIILAGGPGDPFAALAAGQLAASTFVMGTAALDANDYLLYDSATGALLYDADGNGAGAAVQFATIAAGLTGLNSDMFQVSGSANNAPVITSGATASVAENTAAGTIVYQTVAADADGDRIVYTLLGADAGFFTIDANGAVRLAGVPNYEAKSTYSFTVMASDSGLVQSLRSVTMTITDVVEGSTPIIAETAAFNDATASAQAIDRNIFEIADNQNLPNDQLPSATIEGSISGNSDKDFFSITLQAGERLILDVDGTTGGLDPHVRVYGPNGVEIGDNDDQGSFDPGSVPTIASHNTDSFFAFRAPSAGTYYFSIESFTGGGSPGSSGSYEINVSIGPPATPQELLQEDVEALISGAEWPTTSITYSFPNSATDYPAGFGDPSDPEPISFAPFSAAQQSAVHVMLDHISDMTALTFQHVTGSADASAQLRFAMTDATEAAHAYYPGDYDEAGSAWFNKTNFNSPLKGNYAWMAMLHETGHALGLKHGHEPPAISPDHDSVEYSVMTYRSYPGDPISGGYSNEQFGFPQTLMMLDIAALQQIYGANFNYNSTDSVYTWSSSTGEMSINGVGQGAPGTGTGASSHNRILMTIWDGGGEDTYDLSSYGNGVTIDLRPGEWTTTSPIQLANLGEGHTARGNIANALMFEGDPRSLIENAVGGGGNDVLIANRAGNDLRGNGGADTFRWVDEADAGVGALADSVLDFVRGTDRIDLSALDANTDTGANEQFSFIGTAAFSGTAGQLRIETSGNAVLVLGDRDGDAVADLQISIFNNTILAASDFML